MTFILHRQLGSKKELQPLKYNSYNSRQQLVITYRCLGLCWVAASKATLECS